MKTQLELSFERRATHPRTTPRQRRLLRARWWFNQMRQGVERAWSRTPVLSVRPEQTYLQISGSSVSPFQRL
jgi:hypothetical protein